MLLSDHTIRRAVTVLIGSGVTAGAVLLGGVSVAYAEPTPEPSPVPPVAAPPNCTAADLAQVSGAVGNGMSGYLFGHPDVNDFFTGLHGKPYDEIQGEVKNYMDAHPQVESEIKAIRQPLTDLKNRCDVSLEIGQP